MNMNKDDRHVWLVWIKSRHVCLSVSHVTQHTRRKVVMPIPWGLIAAWFFCKQCVLLFAVHFCIILSITSCICGLRDTLSRFYNSYFENCVEVWYELVLQSTRTYSVKSGGHSHSLHSLTISHWEWLRKRRSQDYHSCDLQTTANDVRKAERLNFLPEIQSKVATDCDNSSGTEYKTWGFGWVHS